MAKKKTAPTTSAPASTPPAKPQLVEVNSSSSSEYVYEEVEEEVEVEESIGEESNDEDDKEESIDDNSSESEEEDEDEEDENTKRETLRKLLEPLCKEQIIAFLKEAAEKDSSIISRIAKSTESDPVHRRIFVHGLGWDATNDQVMTIFTQYGEIEDCKVVMDKFTGKAKGYAFILFKTKAGAKKALKQPQKKIGNRMTSCQLSSTGGNSQSQQEHTSGRKIFVANVSPNINSYKLLSLFSAYGEIEEGPLGRDSITGKFKGFAIFIYKTVEGCRKALEDPIKIFEGQQLECRLATEGAPRPNKIQPIAAVPASSIQQTDLGAMSYGFGLNPALLAHYNMNPAAAAAAAAVLLGSNPGLGFANPGIGFANPMMAAAQGLSQSSLAPAAAGLGLSSNYGINPSVLGNYGSQAALQGMGVYQNAQSGHSSALSTSAAEPQRPQSNFGSSAANNYPLYFSR
ncbi:UBP1-associated protein 2A-like [Impatiens glandulifera]|uniref:UBP1-associated protein 2A-like n=1 Tax=Impatiens glandulifera TaxID=253017 RepID=UPI001FB0E2C1|nr:UBP1-associated protein 2A-like [Impatiens glandulifera]